MLGIDLANGADDPAINAVEGFPVAAVVAIIVEAPGRGVADRLVHDVVAGDGRIALVAPGEFLPEGDETVLEVRVLPEVGVAAGVVAVPVRVLPALHRVQVEDGVEVVLRTQLEGAVEALEAGFQVGKRLAVALEMAVVERQPHRVGAGGLDVGEVFIGQEVIEPAVEEELRLCGAEDIGHGQAQPVLVARVAVDEVFHVHPAADARAAQANWLALLVDDLVSFDL